MSDATLLKQFEKLLTVESLEDTNEEVKKVEKRLSAQIKASQKDTIDVLTDVMNSGYNLHGERILRLENKVGLPPIKH